MRQRRCMITIHRVLLLGGSLFAGLAICGCRTPEMNPPTPADNTGYIDFYTDTSMELSWDIKRQDEPSGNLRTVYAEFAPVPGTILRLASRPGVYSFQIGFINRATTGHKAVNVRVEDGKVTPVHVSLVSEGSVSTDTKEYRFGGSAKGYGHGTKIVTRTGNIYRVEAVPGPAREYQPKEHMPYWAQE